MNSLSDETIAVGHVIKYNMTICSSRSTLLKSAQLLWILCSKFSEKEYDFQMVQLMGILKTIAAPPAVVYLKLNTLQKVHVFQLEFVNGQKPIHLK